MRLISPQTTASPELAAVVLMVALLALAAAVARARG